MNLVDLSVQEQIATLRLNDPASRNAMSPEMKDAFVEAVARLQKASDVRVVVLTGTGEAFSAGGDLEMLKKKASISKEDNIRIMKDFYESFLSIRALGLPLVAAINGHAIGAGLCVACACDIRIIVDTAKLGFTFARLGLYPGMASTYFLRRIVGQSRASELLLTGRLLSAQQALDIGLASQVVPSGELRKTVSELLTSLKEASPLVQRALLKTLRSDSSETLEEALSREAAEQAESYTTADFIEGITAVQEKRPPRFTGN